MREGSRLGERERLRLLQHPQSFGQLGRGFGASPPGVKGQASPRPPHSVCGCGCTRGCQQPPKGGPDFRRCSGCLCSGDRSEGADCPSHQSFFEGGCEQPSLFT